MSKFFEKKMPTEELNLSVEEGKKITVNNKWQKNYSYTRTKPTGNFEDLPDFKPELTPNEMLRLGVFEGKYLQSFRDEFPANLFTGAKIADEPDEELNFFKVKSRQPLSVWKENGWINKQDPFGWFMWYVRTYYGRRSDDDDRQVKRWKSFVARHKAQLVKNCKKGDHKCRPVQRQALLQWAIDSRKL